MECCYTSSRFCNSLSSGLVMNAAIMRRKMGMVGGTGRYLSRTTDTDFDSNTNYSFVMFYENSGINPTSHGNAVPFSLWDTSDDSGFYILWYGGAAYFLPGNGTNGGGGSISITNDENYKWGSTATNNAGPTNVLACTYDASANSFVAYNINNGKMSKKTVTYTSTNWGAVGTSTEIRIGNSYDGSSTTYQCGSSWKIGSTSLWFSTLSEANIFALCNLSGTIDNGDEDIGMVYDIGYSASGVPHPNHMWNSSYVNSTDMTTDDGSDGGKTLTIAGSATQGIAPL